VTFIKAECVTLDGVIDESKFSYVSNTVNEKYKRSHLAENDILFSMAGVILGKTALVKKEYLPANTNQALALIRPISQKIVPRYLHYFLQQRSVFHFINNSTSQSAQPNINLQEIGNLDITVPPLPEQKAIAHILGSLDDKIELNRRMNATLERMAQAFFKSWFVDFDPVIDNAIRAGNSIPEEFAERAEVRRAMLDKKQNAETEKSSLHNSSCNTHHSLFPAAFQLTEEMGWIPEGWALKKLKDVCIRIFSGGTPHTKNSEYWNGGIPWLSSGETSQRYILETDKSITIDGVKNSSTRETRKGAVVIASAGQGKTRGQTSYLCFASFINQSVIALEANNSILPDAFLFYDLSRRYEEFRQLSDSHSSRGSLTTKLLYTIDLTIPPHNLLLEFDTVANDVIKKITSNERQKIAIIKLRDTLLPKLISGEICIPDAEKITEEAVA
jgi:type I restriction enzyme, S subunit